MLIYLWYTHHLPSKVIMDLFVSGWSNAGYCSLAFWHPWKQSLDISKNLVKVLRLLIAWKKDDLKQFQNSRLLVAWITLLSKRFLTLRSSVNLATLEYNSRRKPFKIRRMLSDYFQITSSHLHIGIINCFVTFFFF